MTVVGVDAASGGWVAVVLDGEEPEFVFEAERGFAATVAACGDPDLVLVDMPVGLPVEGTRRCDDLARTVLGVRSSTVFSPPTRPVVEAVQDGDLAHPNDYESARERQVGPTLLKQGWNLVPRIGALDAALGVRDGRAVVDAGVAADGTPVRECHPEVALTGLTGGFPLAHSKHDAVGRDGRRRVLDRFLPDAAALHEDALAGALRKQVGRDDPLDAAALAVTASHPEGLASLPASPPTDPRGLPTEIVYPATDGMERVVDLAID